jgi:hypothetical protein
VAGVAELVGAADFADLDAEVCCLLKMTQWKNLL